MTQTDIKPVTKAVIAAAGFGTRFLPQTKAMPKEMLPIIDKPIIQYIVEDLVAAGVRDIIIVGSSNKRAIEDHFDVPGEDLLANLRAGGKSKEHYIEELEAISNLANFVYVRQKGPYGTATPVLNAAHLIGDEPFIYCYADDITVASPNMFEQMIALYQELGGGILPCLKVEEDIEFSRYGILAGEPLRDGVMKMSGVIEKPGKANAPSDFASVGGFLLPPETLAYLEKGIELVPEGKEFYLTDYVIEPMIKDGVPLYGAITQNSKRYDAGDKLEYLKTVVDFALAHDELGADFKAHLLERLSEK